MIEQTEYRIWHDYKWKVIRSLPDDNVELESMDGTEKVRVPWGCTFPTDPPYPDEAA